MLACKVSSDPSVPYNIDWYRDGQGMPITNSQRVGVQADGTLELQAVRASDVGVYSCMVCILNKIFTFFDFFCAKIYQISLSLSLSL